MIYERIWTFVEEARIIHQNQFGFVRGSSTTSAVLSAISQCIDSIESKKSTALVFIDLRKAFDTIDHSLLLSIYQNWVSVALLKWLSSIFLLAELKESKWEVQRVNLAL